MTIIGTSRPDARAVGHIITTEHNATADILDAAAELIEERGWWDGSTGDYTRTTRCALQGIVWAEQNLAPPDADRYAATRAFARFIGDHWDIPSWNDSQPSAQHVTDALRTCALGLRAAL